MNAIFLPGAVLPAELAYGALLEALGEGVDAVAKELARIAERLAGVFADFTLEVFEERHHFDPPHRAEPERLAASLRALWARS